MIWKYVEKHNAVQTVWLSASLKKCWKVQFPLQTIYEAVAEFNKEHVQLLMAIEKMFIDEYLLTTYKVEEVSVIT